MQQIILFAYNKENIFGWIKVCIISLNFSTQNKLKIKYILQLNKNAITNALYITK